MALAQPVWPLPLTAQVLEVVDGDTLLLEADDRRQLRVRLLAVDAPELQQMRGQQARTALGALAVNRRVVVLQIEQNAHGETLAVVRGDPPGLRCAAPPCDPTLDLGLALIAAGQAWHQPTEAGLQPLAQRDAYAQAELMAKLRRLGLWQDTLPQPPWQWRQRH